MENPDQNSAKIYLSDIDPLIQIIYNTYTHTIIQKA